MNIAKKFISRLSQTVLLKLALFDVWCNKHQSALGKVLFCFVVILFVAFLILSSL
jgi:hypothetical protein